MGDCKFDCFLLIKQRFGIIIDGFDALHDYILSTKVFKVSVEIRFHLIIISSKCLFLMLAKHFLLTVTLQSNAITSNKLVVEDRCMQR